MLSSETASAGSVSGFTSTPNWRFTVFAYWTCESRQIRARGSGASPGLQAAAGPGVVGPPAPGPVPVAGPPVPGLVDDGRSPGVGAPPAGLSDISPISPEQASSRPGANKRSAALRIGTSIPSALRNT